MAKAEAPPLRAIEYFCCKPFHGFSPPSFKVSFGSAAGLPVSLFLLLLNIFIVYLFMVFHLEAAKCDLARLPVSFVFACSEYFYCSFSIVTLFMVFHLQASKCHLAGLPVCRSRCFCFY